MAGTVAGLVRKRLVDNWSSDGRLGDVAVHYSYQAEAGDRAIIFGPYRVIESVPVGHRAVKIRRQETVEQPFVISCWMVGHSQEQADDECLAILASIEDIIAEDLQVDGAPGENQQVISLTIKSWRQIAGPIDQGHASEVEVILGYQARSL